MNEGMTTCGRPSRGRYVQGCRCYMCRVANAEYSRKWAHGENEKKMFKRQSADACRRRIVLLLDNGWTKRGICREANVNRNTLRTLLGGHRNTPMKGNVNGGTASRKNTCKVSADFHRRVMALPLHPKRKTGGELVDAKPVNDLLAYLYARGVTPYRVAKESGIPLGTIYQIGDGDRCTFRTMEKLALAADRLREIAEGES